MVTTLLRQVLLSVGDTFWKEHLLSMDHLREGIGLVGYAQKKPIDEYKRQGYAMFSDLMLRTSYEAVTTFYKLQLASPAAVHPIEHKEPEELVLSHGDPPPESKPKAQPVKKHMDIGRNETCPCGSGKKYKKCHGKTK